jgi:hypothetical protein
VLAPRESVVTTQETTDATPGWTHPRGDMGPPAPRRTLPRGDTGPPAPRRTHPRGDMGPPAPRA